MPVTELAQEEELVPLRATVRVHDDLRYPRHSDFGGALFALEDQHKVVSVGLKV